MGILFMTLCILSISMGAIEIAKEKEMVETKYIFYSIILGISCPIVFAIKGVVWRLLLKNSISFLDNILLWIYY